MRTIIQTECPHTHSPYPLKNFNTKNNNTMKKIFTLAACVALCTSTLLADIKIGDTTYNTLSDAITAATNETDVITISGEIPAITSTITITNKSITITGAEDAVITATNTSSAVIVIDTGGSLNMSNVTFDGNNQTWANRNIIEMKAGNNALNNVTFKNAATTHAGGLMRSISNSKVILENVTVENCTVNEGRGEFFCGNNDAITIKGNNNFSSLYIEKNLRIKATALTNTKKITIILEGEKRTNNSIVVSGYNDLSKFEFIGCTEGYEVEVANNDLVYAKQTYVAEFNGENFKTLEDACKAAKESDIKDLNIIDNIELNDRHGFEVPNLIVSGKTGNERIIKQFNNKQMLLTNAATTLKNLILDFNNNSVNNNQEGQIEVGAGNLTLDNVTLTGIPEGGKPAVYAKGQRNVTLNNVKGGATVLLKYYKPENNDYALATISGDNDVKFTLENTLNTINVANDGLSNTTPIDISYTDAAGVSSDNVPANTVVVKNCIDPKLFNITNEGLTLAAKDGNLILAKKVSSGVENVMTEDADAPVEWFNLQGIRVANPENGIYIRRQGSKVEKVVL